jgi:hypothetical protein
MSRPSQPELKSKLIHSQRLNKLTKQSSWIEEYSYMFREDDRFPVF